MISNTYIQYNVTLSGTESTKDINLDYDVGMFLPIYKSIFDLDCHIGHILCIYYIIYVYYLLVYNYIYRAIVKIFAFLCNFYDMQLCRNHIS